jgi:hypothetical protein
MKKPCLVILSDEADPVLKGQCSSCTHVTFSLSNTESSLSLIHGMFSEHFRKVHLHEDSRHDTAGAVKDNVEGT